MDGGLRLETVGALIAIPALDRGKRRRGCGDGNGVVCKSVRDVRRSVVNRSVVCRSVGGRTVVSGGGGAGGVVF